MRLRMLTTLTIAGALALAACGGDDDDGGSAEGTATSAAPAATGGPETTDSPATTAASETTGAPETTGASETTAAAGGGYVAGADPEADAVAAAWTAAFDSTTGFDDKAPFIADAEALRATIEAYTPAGEAVGGIALVPTAIAITGETAAVTYDVMFAGQPAYQDQDGTVERVGGAWVVSRDEFCGFMAAARNPCA